MFITILYYFEYLFIMLKCQPYYYKLLNQISRERARWLMKLWMWFKCVYSFIKYWRFDWHWEMYKDKRWSWFYTVVVSVVRSSLSKQAMKYSWSKPFVGSPLTALDVCMYDLYRRHPIWANMWSYILFNQVPKRDIYNTDILKRASVNGEITYLQRPYDIDTLYGCSCIEIANCN
jgi:hypothetical protein